LPQKKKRNINKVQAEFIILSRALKVTSADPVKIATLAEGCYFFSSARNYANLVNDLK
jgi:hypothetical protein